MHNYHTQTSHSQRKGSSFYAVNRTYDKYFSYTPNLVEFRKTTTKFPIKTRCKTAHPQNRTQLTKQEETAKKESVAAIQKIQKSLVKRKRKIKEDQPYGYIRPHQKKKDRTFDLKRSSFSKFLEKKSIFDKE